MLTLRRPRTISPLGHSADISLRLHVNGQTIPLRQTCNTEIKLGQDIEVAVGPARVEIVVDGVSHISDITIKGWQPNSLWLNIQIK